MVTSTLCLPTRQVAAKFQPPPSGRSFNIPLHNNEGPRSCSGLHSESLLPLPLPAPKYLCLATIPSTWYCPGVPLAVGVPQVKGNTDSMPSTAAITSHWPPAVKSSRSQPQKSVALGFKGESAARTPGCCGRHTRSRSGASTEAAHRGSRR